MKTITHNPRRILVIRDGRVGDMLMMTPTVRWLADRYPDAQIDILVGPYGRMILDKNPAIHNFIVYDKKASPVYKLRAVMRLWGRYDLAVVLESTSSYVVLSWLIRARYRVGIAGKMNRLLHGRHVWNHAQHTIHNNLGVLTPLLAEGETPAARMELHLTEEDHARATSFLETHSIRAQDRMMFVQPACGPNELLRPWPPERVAELVDMAADKLGTKTVLNAGPGEWEAVDKVVRLVTNEVVVNDTDVRTTAALVATAAAVVTPDTGTLHMAGALGTPVVALYGPSSPANYGPVGGQDACAVIYKEFPCSPCAVPTTSPEKEKCLRQ